MIPTQPNISPSGSYGVVEAAKLLGIDRRTLRRYEERGYVAARLNKDMHRRYRGRDLLLLWKRYY